MSLLSPSRKNRAVALLWFLELLAIVAAVTLAAWLRFVGDREGLVTFAQTLPPRAALVATLITTAMAAFGLYQVHVRHNRQEFLLRLTLSFAFGGVGLLVVYYLLPATYIGRGVLLLSLVMGFVGVVATRALSEHLFDAEAFKRRVLVLGAGNNADLINRRLRRSSDRRSLTLVGFVPVGGQDVVVPHGSLVAMGDSLVELATRLSVFEIVVAADERRGGLPMEDLLACAQRGIVMTDLSTFFEREAGVVSLTVTDPSWLMSSGGFENPLVRRVGKRVFDLLAASALLLFAWPIMLLVAASIRLESSGPILYRQVRVGERGRCFELMKFRSMRVDAEADGVAQWASSDDDRATRVGRLTRLTRLDELPQLFNVLRGQMSFVGPRPERPQFVDQLSQEIRYYALRHCVKPGLTGWAQLRYPYGASVRDAEEKLKFDLFYVKNHGVLFDLLILLQTVEVVLFRRGAR